MIEAEVCYALPHEQIIVPLHLAENTTVVSAILQSGILDRYPEIELSNAVGIFSKKVPLTQIVAQGDRIEIYRSLTMSPNQQRLRRRKL